MSAGDADKDQDTRIEYIIQGDDGKYFAIDKDNGIMTLKRVVDRETKGMLRFNVVAYDNDKNNNSLKGYAEIIVQVKDINDNSPIVGVSYTLFSLFLFFYKKRS